MIIALCGSGRYREEIHRLGDGLVEAGFVVLLPPLHDIDGLLRDAPEEAHLLAWKGATFAHMNRIDKADAVLFVNLEGYLGVSSTIELGYAVARQKLTLAMLPDRDEPARTVLFDIVLDMQSIDGVAQRLRKVLHVMPG